MTILRCLETGCDFCKATYAPKLFGMHIGSVLSGPRAENVNTDPKMSFLLMLGVGKVCACGRSKITFFRSLEALEGTFIRETHGAKLFGMHIGSVLSGLEAGNVNNDREIPN